MRYLYLALNNPAWALQLQVNRTLGVAVPILLTSFKVIHTFQEDKSKSSFRKCMKSIAARHFPNLFTGSLERHKCNQDLSVCFFFSVPIV